MTGTASLITAIAALLAAVFTYLRGNRTEKDSASVGMVERNYNENQRQIKNLRDEVNYWKSELRSERERCDGLEARVNTLEHQLRGA